ncbi:MAG: PadR family transcriptional regulator [Acetobacter sp.]|nr:PadR family transcriptional regulator [Acetobacter sp.]MCH4060940.1 PadR family transcriptional regulator [Acetobacter sp.]MCH4087880.1 PadR family transcriptional regulator [Acetobacter sp.]MCI1293504.1 PadR family transcriptional regulator [Acetobacter sp.]MCI1319788.1 PadR family transcriptional regulator [Acetobacter sp.]
MEPNLVQFKKGVLELCVMAVLARADSYGYDIASQLSEAIGMGEGTIYPLMRRMQKDGIVSTYFVESPSGPPRKYYSLTDLGRSSLTAQRTAWESFASAVSALLRPASDDAPSGSSSDQKTITVSKAVRNDA